MLVLDPTDPAALPPRARAALLAEPVRHTIALLLLATAERDPAGSPLGSLLVRDGPAGPQVLLGTPGRPLVATTLTPDGVAETAAHLAAAGPGAGVTAEPDVADALLAATGCRATAGLDLRLFRLVDLVPPVGVPGRAHLVDGDDPAEAARVGAQLDRFAAEAGVALSDHSGQAFAAACRARGHALLEWWCDGEPVALACARAAVAGVARLGPVWTDDGRRGRGFGAAVTAAAAAHARRTGADEVCLYTDVDEPGPNRLYPRVGFVPVRDHREQHWAPA